MNSTSLRWRFTLGFIILQFCAIAASLILVFYLVSDVKRNGAITSIWLLQEVADSVRGSQDQRAYLSPTRSLTRMIEESPTLWFLVKLGDGTFLSHGEVPGNVAAGESFLENFRSVDLHGYLDDPTSVAKLDRLDTAVGEAIIFAGGVSMSQYSLIVMLGNIAIGVPALILAAITLVGVPLVTRWALRSFNDVTDRLEKIDFGARGGVVDSLGLPREVWRVIDGINMALRRLDTGFEATERFFVNAAHELRTPIAILQVRIDTLAPGAEKSHLQAGIKRLTTIINQLLDIEKYRQKPPTKTVVELNEIVSKVVADLAPFAIAEGYDVSFDSQVKQVFVIGDPEALERAVTNLVRNAVQYGGQAGDIQVGIESDGSIYVADQGQGIPGDKQARIFDPFYRVSPHGSGAGLGLSMVDEIVTGHGGYIELASKPGKGSRFVVRWRENRVSYHAAGV